jgi:hypothetical protein
MRAMHLDTGKTSLAAGRRRNCEPFYHGLDFSNVHGNRLAELPSRDRYFHSGRRPGLRVDRLGGLPAGVAQLGPEGIAPSRRGSRPRGQRSLQFRLGFAVDDHVARPFQVIAVDLDIAGDQQAGTAVAPQAVQPVQSRCGYTARRRQPLGHGSLRQAVGQRGAAGEGNRPGQQIRHRRIHQCSFASPRVFRGTVC